MVVAFDKLPDALVMVSVAVPGAAVVLAVSVNMLELAAGFGLNAAVTPLGRPATEKVTLLLKPP